MGGDDCRWLRVLRNHHRLGNHTGASGMIDIGCGWCGEPVRRHFQNELAYCLAKLTQALHKKEE